MAIEVKKLSFSYTNDEKMILKNIELNFETGRFVCLLGQSGCGKSTLLRLMAGFEKPTEGEICINGKKIEKPGLDTMMVFQDYGLFPWKTAGENIALAIHQKWKKKSKKECREIAEHWIEQVGLPSNSYDKLPKELSGGMQQRCAIARAFAVDAPHLFMDEPFGALDAVTRAKLQDLVLDLWKTSAEENNAKTISFVTHDVDEALLLATDIMVLGQEPSTVIYQYHFENKTINRNNIYESDEIVSLRNELIKIINSDIRAKVGSDT